jgi:drug/metabolite transporter (DMT)-like permease
MIWIFLSILAGLGDATTWAFMKRLKDVDNLTGALAKYFFALPFIAFMLFFFPREEIPLSYWPIMLLNAAGIFSANYFIFKATKKSDISRSLPLITFTPLLLLLTSTIMVNEFPSFLGLAGMLLIVIGAYWLNISKAKESFLEPFKLLIRNKAPRYILIAAIIYSITSNLTKIGVKLTNPGFFSFSSYLIISLFFTPFIIKNIREVHLKKNIKNLIIIGIANGMMMIAVTVALTQGIVPYVISLKRTNALFTVLYGLFMFKEKGIKNSVIATLLMVIGVIIIGFA